MNEDLCVCSKSRFVSALKIGHKESVETETAYMEVVIKFMFRARQKEACRIEQSYNCLYNNSITNLEFSLSVSMTTHISDSILLNIMFHAPLGRFQLELIYSFTYFSPSSHPTLVCFFPVGLSLLIQQETEETSTPPRPVEK